MSQFLSSTRTRAAFVLALATIALPAGAASQNPGQADTAAATTKAVETPVLDLTKLLDLTKQPLPFPQYTVDLRSLLQNGLSLRVFIAQPSWVDLSLTPVSGNGSNFSSWYNTTSSSVDSGSGSQSSDDVLKRVATLQITVTPVPEPSDWLVMGAGLTMLAAIARRRARRTPQ